jgi:hypothetical protein
MQRGNLAIVSRKEGPAVWQFRWSEKDLHFSRKTRRPGTRPKLLLSVGPELVHSTPYRFDSVGGLEEPSQDRSMD